MKKLYLIFILMLVVSSAFGAAPLKSIMESNKFVMAPPGFWPAQTNSVPFSNVVNAVVNVVAGGGISVAAGSNVFFGTNGSLVTINSRTDTNMVLILSSNLYFGSNIWFTNATLNAATNAQNALLSPDGTAAKPMLSFNSDTNTGIYRIGDNILGIAINGTNVIRIANSYTNVAHNTSFGPLGGGGSFVVHNNAQLINGLNVANGFDLASGSATFAVNVSASGIFNGDGSGLTNLYKATNHIVVVGATSTNSTGGVTAYTVTGSSGDFVPRSGTNMTGGLTNDTFIAGNGAGLTNLGLANNPLYLSEYGTNVMELALRPTITAFPVAVFRPLTNNTAGIVDIMPKGTAAGASLPTRLDICDVDFDTVADGNFFRAAIDTVAGYLDMQKAGSATLKEMNFRINGTTYGKLLTAGNWEYQNTVAGQSYWRFGNLSTSSSAFANLLITSGFSKHLYLGSYDDGHATYPDKQYVHGDGAGLILGADAASGTIHFLTGGTSPTTNKRMVIESNGDVTISTLLTVTNGYFFPSNALSVWPTAPRTRGESYVGNSNGFIYMLCSDGLGALAWTKTNVLATPN